MRRAALASILLVGCQGKEPTTSEPADTGTAVEDTQPTTTDVGPSAEALEELLEPIRASNNLPALAGAVFSSDGLLAIGAVGVRKQGDATPVTRDDKWHLGSDTKAMSATLHAMYVAEGKATWDQTMSSAFAGATMSDAYKPVTIDQLFRHRAGAPASVPTDIWSEMWKSGDPMAQRRAAVLSMLALEPTPAPGTSFVYSNAGYMMAGAALEEATKKSWESMMRERLFASLAMPSCGFGAPATVGQIDHPWGHTLKSGKPSPVAPGPGADNPPSLGPAGTVHCTLQDWGKFLVAHLKGARGVMTPILDVATFKRLQTPATGEDYAHGWGVGTRSWAGGAVLSHSGSNTMFYVTVWIAPNIDRVFVAATNLGGDGAAKAIDAAFAPLIERYAK
jgi:D-alanyl-D-alanine carboxypeptidase